MRWLVVFLIPFLFIQCSKEEVTTAAPSLIGNWIHNKDNSLSQQIEIAESGEGYIKSLEDGVVKGTTKARTWYIKDNELHFGKAAFNGEYFPIDTYPTESTSLIINGTDTINPGDTYMVLDEDYYKSIE